jgi:hypothetical protein
MKKLLCTAACIISLQVAFSQTTVPSTDTSIIANPQIPAKKTPKIFDLSNRSNDHFLLQYGFDGWSGTPDSISPKGFSRHFNAYVMLDRPFKTNPRFSVAFGLGVSSSNIFFKGTYVDVRATSTTLPFRRVDSTDHFKKFKLTTVFAEIPVELRFNTNPSNSNKGYKIAIGAKVGTLINVHTKGKTLENKNGQTLNSYTEKENSKRFFNTTRVAATARVGYGFLSLFGSYQFTQLLKDGAGPDIKPYSIGITLSGL